MDYEKELATIIASADENMNRDIDNPVVVLYGAGSLGRMAMDILSQTNIRPTCIVDKQVQGSLSGIRISCLNELSIDIKKNALFLVTICTVPYQLIEEELRNLGIEYIMPFYTYAYLAFPQWLSNGWFLSEVTAEVKERILKICGLLRHDEYSIHHYMQFCWWKIRGREVIYENYPVLRGKKYFGSPCMPNLGSEEFLIDCGCHEGTTIRQFIEVVDGQFKGVYAFEPDLKNLIQSQNAICDNRVIFDKRAVASKSEEKEFVSDLGFASKLGQHGNQIVNTVAIDELEICPTIIKIHVEGNEYDVMQGAINTIKRFRPILMVFADHTEEGMYEIPVFIQELEKYKLYFNLHDYCGNSAVFYMIPDERMGTNESRI